MILTMTFEKDVAVDDESKKKGGPRTSLGTHSKDPELVSLTISERVSLITVGTQKKE
jgi:hypothetical protein